MLYTFSVYNISYFLYLIEMKGLSERVFSAMLFLGLGIGLFYHLRSLL